MVLQTRDVFLGVTILLLIVALNYFDEHPIEEHLPVASREPVPPPKRIAEGLAPIIPEQSPLPPKETLLPRPKPRAALNERFKPANPMAVPEINVIDHNASLIAKTFLTGESLAQIEIDNHTLSTIVLENPSDQGKIRLDEQVHNDSQQSFAIDPVNQPFTTAEVHLTAKGNRVYKCARWNFDERRCPETCVADEEGTECFEDWELHEFAAPNQAYSIILEPNDPAFFEASEAVDLSLTPLSEDTLAVAFIDDITNDVAFKVMDTQGNTITQVTVDAFTDLTSRVTIAALNQTTLALAWVDGTRNDLRYALYHIDGSTILAPTTIDYNIGTNTDVKIAVLDDRFMVCNANDADNDADYQIYDFSGNQIRGESRVDGNMRPSARLQNVVDCAAVGDSFQYVWFDDASNDASYAKINAAGQATLRNKDFDRNVGELGQIATTALNKEVFTTVYYDYSTYEVMLAFMPLASQSPTTTLTLDSNAGRQSRVAITAAQTNSTNPDVAVVAWYDHWERNIQAAVYDHQGQQITAPFEVVDTPDASFRLLDVAAKDQNTICPGTFMVGFTNATDQGQFLTFYINGSVWNGVCTRPGDQPTDLIADGIGFATNTPKQNELIPIKFAVRNNGSTNIPNVFTSIHEGSCDASQLANHTFQHIDSLSSESTNHSITLTEVGPHNIFLCIDIYNTTNEPKHNNHINQTLHVDAYHIYYGNIAGNVTLDTNTSTVFAWGANSGLLAFYDADMQPNLFALQALGRKVNGDPATNDFQELDTLLNMSHFRDSIENTWAQDASTPKETATINFFGQTIQNAPIVNSTTYMHFSTLILYDTTQDTNGEFDGEEQPIFVTIMNKSQAGSFGTYDYEGKIPVRLGTLNPTTTHINVLADMR